MAVDNDQRTDSVSGHATIYNYQCNQSEKYGPFGSSITMTGSNSLHANSKDNQFTGAILLEGAGKGVFKPGDIVIAENNVTHKKVLLVLDDTGHGDDKGAVVDISEGPASDALGATDVVHYGDKRKNGTTISGGPNGGVAGSNGLSNLTFTKVAHVDTADKELLKKTITKVGEINTKQENGVNTGKLSELEGPGVTIATDSTGAKVNTDQVVSNANVKVTQTYASTSADRETQTRDRLLRGYTHDREKTKEENEKTAQENMLAQLKNMPPEEQIMMLFLAMMFGIFTGKNIDEAFGAVSQATGRTTDDLRRQSGNFNREVRDYDGQPVTGAPDVWTKAWKGGHGDAAATQDLLNTVPEARDAVAKDPTGKLAVYQELKGTGNHTYGVFVFKDSSGKVTCLAQAGGGAGGANSLPGASTGTGNGMVDPRYPGEKNGIPDYQIGNRRDRNPSEHLGPFTFDLSSNGSDDVGNTGHGAFRIHVGATGSDKSLGCQHLSPKDTTYGYNELGKIIAERGKLTYHIMVTKDKDNVLYKHISPQQIARDEAPAVPTATPAPAASKEPKSAAVSEKHPFADYVAQLQQHQQEAKTKKPLTGLTAQQLADVRPQNPELGNKVKQAALA